MKNVILATILSLGFGTASFAQECNLKSIDSYEWAKKEPINPSEIAEKYARFGNELESMVAKLETHANLMFTELDSDFKLQIKYKNEDLHITFSCQ